jgi:drug/metabolite transporter (DMT)-like permease
MADAAATDTRAPEAPALWLTLVMGVGFALIWSSAFSVGKVLVEALPPFGVSAARFATSALLAGGLALALGQRPPRGRAAWRAIVVLGLCQNAVYLGFFFNAMTMIPAGLAAILASTMPLVVATLAALFLGERLTATRALGLGLGFGGVVWIMAARLAGGIEPAGVAIALCGVMGLAVATLTVKRGGFGAGLLMVVACQMAVGAAGCAVLAAVFEPLALPAPTVLSPAILAAFAFQVLVPGIGATLLWFALVGRVSAAGASSFHFLNPAFGVGFAWALLGEPVGARDAAGVALVALGILIVNRARAGAGPHGRGAAQAARSVSGAKRA